MMITQWRLFGRITVDIHETLDATASVGSSENRLTAIEIPGLSPFARSGVAYGSGGSKKGRSVWTLLKALPWYLSC
ncbi:hypothetical protein TWF594_009489 [Orbilia oligospora]|nr:hypothetical protein TWF594_009489 [Orbilia oligospora]